jgi:ubiquinone/menaquinone biosynthesis C-methylase UbiE
MMNHDETTSYNIRQVRYELIHHITSEQFDALHDALGLQDGDAMLDAGCGYGSATREMVQRNGDKDVSYVLLDQSRKQLEGAEAELSQYAGISFEFFNLPLTEHPFRAGQFQKILLKKVLHEFPKEQHVAVLREARRLLAPGGRLVVWQNVLDELSQPFFQSVMLKKDQLAGFSTLVRNRYFPSESYFGACARAAGFQSPVKAFDFDYHVETSDRLEQELHSDLGLLAQWNQHLNDLAAATPALREHVRFVATEGSVGFTIRNAIYILNP